MPPGTRAEYVTGYAVTPGPRSPEHGRACQRLVRQFSLPLPGSGVVCDLPWVIRDGQVVRVPDVMVLDLPVDRRFVVDAPALVV